MTRFVRPIPTACCELNVEKRPESKPVKIQIN